MNDGPAAPVPEPEELDWLSASAAESLRACRLRVAFSRDRRFSYLRRTSPPALLGRASHALAEMAHRGDFAAAEDGKASAALRWSELMAESQKELANDWGGDVPDPERWPGYQLLRVRALRRAEEISRQRFSRSHSTGAGNTRLEETLRDPENQLYGRPDRVTTSSHGTVIHDLKSGWATQTETTPRHRRQLLFYAHLWRVEHGSLPEFAAVEGGDGKEAMFPVEAAEVDAWVRDAIGLRQEFNRSREGSEPDAMASPAAATCAHCDFRAVCAPYLRATADDWEWATTRAGWVGDVRTVDDRATIDMDTVWPRSVAGESVRVTRMPRENLPELGDFMVIANAEPTASPAQIRARWDSLIELWDEPTGAQMEANAPAAGAAETHSV